MTYDEILEAMREAEKFIFRHSEPWYVTGQEARRKIRAAIAALEGMRWQPIETAPKDGTYILIIDLTAETPEADKVHWAENVWRCGDELDWKENPQACREVVGVYRTPTHWMPLPIAPNKTGEE